MSRAISSKTIERYKFLIEYIDNANQRGDYLTQTTLSEGTGIPQPTISRMFRTEPWRVSFETGMYGRIKTTGEVVDLDVYTKAPDNEIWTVKRLVKELVNLTPPVKGVIAAGFKTGNPTVTLSKAVQAYKAKLQGTLSDDELNEIKFLNGRDVEKIIDDTEQFAIELLRLVNTTRAQTNYGKNDWWLPYVEV